ncbi:MAG: acyl carrier protein [Bacteroidota bacterium]
MDINKFIEKFSQQFDETDADVFTPEIVFKELEEWSSLTALSVIAMIDDEYGVMISGKEIEGAEHITDLFELVVHKKNN